MKNTNSTNNVTNNTNSITPKQEAIENAKVALGADFGKACTFWKSLKKRNKLRKSDYVEMKSQWLLLQALLAIDEGINAAPENYDIHQVAHILRGIFAPAGVSAKNVENWSDSDCSDYIHDTMRYYSNSTTTERLHKEQCTIIKMSMDDIIAGDDGTLYFDSSKASRFVGDDIVANKEKMRIVETAEDGISRMLLERGLNSVTVFMGKVSTFEDEMILINKHKYNIFKNGFTDASTGKHYLFAFQNPSSKRKANFMFVEANSWDEIFQLWFEITGTKNKNGFEKAFGTSMNAAKTLARISTRGSNSFNTEKIAPEWIKKVQNYNVIYCPDASGHVSRPYKTFDANGNLVMVSDKSRDITPGDGQGYMDISVAADISAIMRVITLSEYHEFNSLWNVHCLQGGTLSDVKEGSRLYKLINKIIKAAQIRHGEKKGMLFVVDIKNLPNGTLDGKEIDFSNVDLIIPESVRKFIGGEWSEYPLEICNFLRKKGDFVSLNPQFEAVLDDENPNFLLPIVKYWLNYMQKSLHDIAVAQQFHGIAKSSDDEGSDDRDKVAAAKLVKALRTSSDLLDESQICNWRKDQYRKMLDDMKMGNILVPGMYTYMVCDPFYCLNNIFNLSLEHLSSGQTYHNGKTCKAGLFRAPLIAPFEAQKVNLADVHPYWYFRDVVIFNGYDGLWDCMGGGDFDGDTCAVICDDTEHGKIIVDAIRSINYDIWEVAKAAEKINFTCSEKGMEELFKYLTENAKVDRTGIITNYATRALDIANHIKSAIRFAKRMGAESLTFVHPQVFGNDKEPLLQNVDGKYTFCIRGIVEAYIDENQTIKYKNDNAIVGTYSFEDAETIANNFMVIVEYLRLYQGEEIDGAKTGYHPELLDFVKVIITPMHMITRQNTLKRPVSSNTMINSYRSLSPLGRVHDYIEKYEKGEIKDDDGNNIIPIMEQLDNGNSKKHLLLSLLTQEERECYNKGILMEDNSTKTIVEIIKLRKDSYNSKMKSIMDSLSDSERFNAVDNLKNCELRDLEYLSDVTGLSLELISVAAYDAVYTKTSNQNKGLTYAWLLFDELLSVFSRAAGTKFELFRLPANSNTVYIKDGFMFVNDKQYIQIDAEDCDNIVIDSHGSKKYALVHKRQKNTIEPKVINVVPGATYSINVRGFKYHIANGTSNDFERIVANNNYLMDVNIVNGNAVISVNGMSLCRYGVENPFELVGHTVKVIASPDYKKTSGAINNMNVVIVK